MFPVVSGQAVADARVRPGSDTFKLLILYIQHIDNKYYILIGITIVCNPYKGEMRNMVEMTWQEAVETLKSLLNNPDEVLISDGAENWEIDSLIEHLKYNSDEDELVDVAVNEESITIIKPDGYLESVPFYKVVLKDN